MELSRRERQIMDAVYQLREASAADVARRLEDRPGVDTVRVTLRNLEKKGHLKHRQDGRHFVYIPVEPPERARTKALRSVTRTFFSGSPSKAILTMLDLSSSELSQADLDEIAEWINQEREDES